MSDRVSDKMKALAYMMKHGSITNADAAREFDCYRLSARILDLRADGIPIDTIMEKNPKTGSRYGRYVIRT